MKPPTDPRAALAAIPPEATNIFNNTLALRGLIDGMTKHLVPLALGTSAIGPNTWNPANYVGSILPHLDERHPAALAALAVLEKSPEFQAAEKLIVPILAALAELEAREAAAALKHADAERRHAAAIATAEARLRAAALLEPEVASAARALAAA